MIPLVRSLISIPAGMSNMNFNPFLLYTTFGTLICNIVLVSAGLLSVSSSNRFEYEMIQLLQFAENKISFNHVNIATIYLENNQSSHFSLVRDSVRIYSNILKYGALLK
jgi:membrane protein DedA with SNARE-associated domain